MASLALGWIGEPALAHFIEPAIQWLPFIPSEARTVASHTIAVSVGFAVITALHIVLGELAPKSIALQRTEATALLVVGPIHVFLAVFRLPILALNALGNLVVRTVGIQPAAGHALVQSAEELKLAVSASREAGLVSEQEQEVVERALEFDTWTAHQVMVPRTEMIGIPVDASLGEVVEMVHRYQHSRYPVYARSLDNVVGIVSAKRLLDVVASKGLHDPDFRLREHVTAPVFVPETMHAYPLLAEMKRQRSHLAVVINEYGVTAGLVTLRDLTARIAGEVPDESEPNQAEFERLPDGSISIDGLALLEDVADALGVPVQDAAVDTLGGYIFGRLGRKPEVGDTITLGDYVLRVEELDALRIARVRASRPGERTPIPSVFTDTAS
jgi:CBS domain containing-hemolysin-like protein